jgi:8-oxo-dGTP diphosphatase
MTDDTDSGMVHQTPTQPVAPSGSGRRLGVVGVLCHSDRLLVIRRAAYVAAPGAWCFPGGAVEPGESEPEALVRELREELGLNVTPQRCIWQNEAPWGVHLRWWLAQHHWPREELRPSPAEVQEAVWLTIPEILQLPGLLSTNREFLLQWVGNPSGLTGQSEHG